MKDHEKAIAYESDRVVLVYMRLSFAVQHSTSHLIINPPNALAGNIFAVGAFAEISI